jgi:hypothetical protein
VSECCEKCARPLDLVRLCLDCGRAFSINLGEQLRMAKLEYQLPRRCGSCRASRRTAKTRAQARPNTQEVERAGNEDY